MPKNKDNELKFDRPMPTFNTENFNRGFGGSLTKDVNYASMKNPGIKGFYSSRHFGELFKEMITNSNCKYGTYLEGKVKSLADIPTIIKVLVKDVRTPDCVHSELAASRILNLLGIYTTYNSAHRTDKSVEWGLIDYDYFYSVFFEKEGYDFIPLNNLVKDEDFVDNDTPLSNWVSESMDAIRRYFNSRGLEYDRNCMFKFLEEMSMSYLSRITLLGDYDCGCQNMGGYFSQTDNTFYFAPNFDLEFAFRDSLRINTYLQQAKNNLTYAQSTFPVATERLINKIKDALRSGDIDKIIDKKVIDLGMASLYKERVNNNALNMIGIYDEIIHGNHSIISDTNDIEYADD